MTFDPSKIQAIIFDLGGVLINLDISATIKAFATLSGQSTEFVENCYEQADFFKAYEIGAISDSEFREAIRTALNMNISDLEIDKAWNATLADIPMARVKKLEVLAGQFQLFVMSNTNDIHVRHFLEKFEALNSRKSFHDYFDKVYFSQEIGARKPDAAAWSPIIEEYDLDPAKTLFIDDRLDNIEAAQTLGLRTFHNVNPDDWLELP